jgi:hypothetical protein
MTAPGIATFESYSSCPWRTCPPGYAKAHLGIICAPCELGVTFSSTHAQGTCDTVTTCAVGTIETSPPTLSSDRACQPCSAGTFAETPTKCTTCPNGTFSSKSGSGSCASWSPPCQAGASETAAPTTTSDRVCADINACVHFPCSIHSSCQDLPNAPEVCSSHSPNGIAS